MARFPAKLTDMFLLLLTLYLFLAVACGQINPWDRVSAKCKKGLESIGNNTEYQKQEAIFVKLNKGNFEKNCPCKTLQCECDLEKTWLGLHDMQLACQNAEGILCSTDIFVRSDSNPGMDNAINVAVKKEAYHCKSLQCSEEEFSHFGIDFTNDLSICKHGKGNNCRVEVKCSVAKINMNDVKNGMMLSKYLWPIGIGCGVILLCFFVCALFYLYRQERDARWSFDDSSMVEMSRARTKPNQDSAQFSGNGIFNRGTARRRTVSAVTGKTSYAPLDTSDSGNFVDVDLDQIRSGSGSQTRDSTKPKLQLV